MQYVEFLGIVQQTVETSAFDMLDLVVSSPVQSCAILGMVAICGFVARSFLFLFTALVLGILHLVLFLPQGISFDRVTLSYVAGLGLLMMVGVSLTLAWGRRRAHADVAACRSELRRVQAQLDQEIIWRRAAENVDETRPRTVRHAHSEQDR